MRCLIALLLCMLAWPIHALDFAYTERYDSGVAKKLRISGTIVAGDHQKFIAFVRQNPQDALAGSSLIELDSTGGDVKEAMALAARLKDLYPKISVAGVCASSCVLLWLSASARHVDSKGRIGIHRPSFAPAYFRGLSVKEAETRYAAMSDSYRQFILGQGLPLSLYEKLMATASTEIYWLSARDLDLIGIRPPYYDEKLKASCGKYLDKLLRDGTDADRFKACDLLLARREKAAAIDAMLGAQKNAAWEKFRDNYLGRIRETAPESGAHADN